MKNKRIAILTPTFSYYSGIDRVAKQQAGDYAKADEMRDKLAAHGLVVDDTAQGPIIKLK